MYYYCCQAKLYKYLYITFNSICLYYIIDCYTCQYVYVVMTSPLTIPLRGIVIGQCLFEAVLLPPSGVFLYLYLYHNCLCIPISFSKYRFRKRREEERQSEGLSPKQGRRIAVLARSSHVNFLNILINCTEIYMSIYYYIYISCNFSVLTSASSPVVTRVTGFFRAADFSAEIALF